MADFPNLAMRLFATPAMAHLVFSNCVGPVTYTGREALDADIRRLQDALDGADPSQAFMTAVSPGQIAFNYPDQHYGSHESYLGALADALSQEYRAITDAGFGLQIDSPDLAMAAHCRSVGSSVGDWHTHLPLAIDALNAALDGIPPEQVRLHVCWGNYGGPHHKDVAFKDIVARGAARQRRRRSTPRAPTRATSTSGGSSRRSSCPSEMSVILGVIDVKSNCIEHPQVVADRLIAAGPDHRPRAGDRRDRLRLRHLHPLLAGRSRRRLAEAPGAQRRGGAGDARAVVAAR